MKQRDNQEENVNPLDSSDQPDVSGRIENGHQNVGAAEPEQIERSQLRLGHIIPRLLAARNALRYPASSILTSAKSPDASTDEEIREELSEVDILTVDVARWLRRLLIPLAILAWAGVAILILNAAGYITRTLLLLGIAILLAYALSPLVTFFARAMPRFLAILIVYLLVFGAIGTLLYFIVRTTVEQLSSLSHYIAILLTPGKNGHPSTLEQRLQSFGISQNQIASVQGLIITQVESLAGNIVLILTGVASAAIDIILVIVMSIYLMIDGKRVTNWLRQNMPRRQRGRIRFLLDTVQRVVGGYIRGQLFLCTLIGSLVGIGMQILGVPYALLLGVLAFFLEFIPVLGTIVSGAICVLFALTRGWLLAVIVLVYFVFVHIIEGDVVGPRIVGKVIGIHPVVSLVALLIGGELFGIWGALFAAPIAGVIQAFLIAFWYEWHEIHNEDFQGVKDRINEEVEKHTADKLHDSESENKPLS